jgi:hypothetical protein
MNHHSPQLTHRSEVHGGTAAAANTHRRAFYVFIFHHNLVLISSPKGSAASLGSSVECGACRSKQTENLRPMILFRCTVKKMRLVHTIPIQGVAFCERVLAFEKNPIQAT